MSSQMEDDFFSLKGEVSVSEGLALTNHFSLEIYRTHGGEILEEGEVFLTEGRYEIFFTGSHGYIEAVLRNEDGEVIGYESVSLLEENLWSQLQASRSHPNKEAVLPLNLKPAQRGLVTTAISATSYKDKKILEPALLSFGSSLNSAIITKDGKVFDERWRKDSYMLFGVYSENEEESRLIEGTLSWVDFVESSEVKKFSEPLIRALKDWIPELAEKFFNKSIIWGRVTDGSGQSLANAKILVNQPNSRVYYFSGFLPDKDLTKTSENGEFVIVTNINHPDDLDVDLQGVKVIYGEGSEKEVWPTEMVAVERGACKYGPTKVTSL